MSELEKAVITGATSGIGFALERGAQEKAVITGTIRAPGTGDWPKPGKSGQIK